MAKEAAKTATKDPKDTGPGEPPEHMRRVYNIKKYHGKGYGYSHKGLHTLADAQIALKSIAAKLKAAGKVPSMADDGMSFTCNEGTKEKPSVSEYKIV